MSHAGRWLNILFLTTLVACTPKPRSPHFTVEVRPLPLELRGGVHQPGLGVWVATLWGSGNVRVQGAVDLVSDTSTVPFDRLLGHELPGTARSTGSGPADTFDLQLGFAPDSGSISHFSSDDGSVSLYGRRIGADTVRGEWFEATYGGGHSGIFLLVRCPTQPPSDYCVPLPKPPRSLRRPGIDWRPQS